MFFNMFFMKYFANFAGFGHYGHAAQEITTGLLTIIHVSKQPEVE